MIIMREWPILVSAGIIWAGSIRNDWDFIFSSFSSFGSHRAKQSNISNIPAYFYIDLREQNLLDWQFTPSLFIVNLSQLSTLTFMINTQPFLYGSRFIIRPLKPEDFQKLYQAASDKLIWQQHPQPRRAERQFFKNNYFTTGIQSQGALIFQNTRNQAIGCSRYYNYRPQTSDITIGYTFLTRDYWGEQTNREIKHLMMTHIYPWVQTIYFTVGVNNLRSRRAMQKIGGQLLTPEMQKVRNYTLAGSVIYQIHKKDFKGLL